jgi:transposase
MNPLPNEMRKHILLDDCNIGRSEVAAAKKWGVSSSFITQLKRHVRETGSVEPKNGKRGAKSKLEPYHHCFKKIVADTPDATLFEIREDSPVAVSHQTVANELKKLKLVYKKTTESLRTGTTGRCPKAVGMEMDASWFEPKKLVFLDETSAKTNMTRLYG